ncbi:MAG: Fic family protein [Saprospiraceae bacterium]|nr:Fic family protein [Saprospiraceae bacterium]
MNTLALFLKESRKKKDLTLKDLSHLTGIDSTLLSKIERSERSATKEQIQALKMAFPDQKAQLSTLWLAEKLYVEMQDEEMWKEAMVVAEERMQYVRSQQEHSKHGFDSTLQQLESLMLRLGKLRQHDSYRIAEALEIEYTHDSNKIEGNTLTLQETNLVVNKGLTISGKSMQEHLEAVNHYDAIQFIKDMAARKIDITKRSLLELHYLILRGIDRENAGRYRSVQVYISGSKHIPPQPYMIEKEMEDFFIWYESAKIRIHPVILAAEVHQRVVSIHPFIDGNGRTCRLLMNLILLQHGYVIANIRSDTNTKSEYYKALENSNETHSNDGFIEFVLKTEIKSLEHYLLILNA